MWTCPKCQRIFQKAKQPHSCHKMALAEHFENKALAKELFDFLYKKINSKIGKCKIISLPCCIHLFGRYDFFAALPKKDRLEIRFGLNRKLTKKRVKMSVPVSLKSFKICIDIKTKKEIDKELLKWIDEAYFLKDK
ncbi:MAG: DUF5655 domain-containing protein [Patescibacteria group bacterium]|jgi:hypothetical protein